MNDSGPVFQLQVGQHGQAVVARLVGSANMVASSDLKERLIALAEAHPCNLILDLTELEFISSVGLGGIIAAHLRARRQQGIIRLVNPNPDIRDLLHTTKLNHLFPIHDTIDEALNAQ